MRSKKTLIVAGLSLAALALVAFSGLAHDLVRRLGSPGHEEALAAREALARDVPLETAFEAIAEAIQPSVVAIASKKLLGPAGGPRPFPGHPFFDDPFFRRQFGVPEGAEPPAQRGLGSGIIISADGYILTNNHVVGEADSLEVHLFDKRRFAARVVGGDPRTDVAVIKIETTGLLPARLGDSDRIKVGQWVAAFGCPFGLEQSLTAGIVSAKGRANVGIVDYEDFIQTDAAINRGNSGGPLVNLKGEVIGINTAIFSQSGTNVGVSFAIPSNLARPVMERLMSDGKVVRGWLGVLIQDLNAEVAGEIGLPAGTQGVLVNEITSGGPAEAAGLEAGDVLLRLDGEPIPGVTAFRNRVASLPPGTTVKLLRLRDRTEAEVAITIGELPSQEELLVRGRRTVPRAAPAPDALGLVLSDLPPELRSELGVEGALVAEVAEDSAAAGAGISAGDVVVAVARKPVKNAQEAKDALAAADLRRGVALRVRSGDTTRFIFLRTSR